MPDQSSAATEHAIIQEITAPLEHLPDDPVAVVRADFPTALRGYDRMAVDAYVQQMSQLVAEMQATRSPEAAVRRALERVGDQISGILQRAHETAEQITAQSRREAEDRLEEARTEARDIVESAERHIHDLDADTDRIWIERGRIVDDARDLARQLLSVADEAAARFPEPDPGDLDASAPAELYDDDEPAADAAIPAPHGTADELPFADPAEPADPPEFEDELTQDEPTPAPDATADPAVAEPPPEDETRVYEDVEATVRYDPLQPEPEADEEPEPSGDGEPGEPQVRGTRAAIPPASQAANRRQRD